MGHANLPMLNRAGETIFWNSNSENLIDFCKCFCESYLLQKALSLLCSSYSVYYLFYLNNFNKKKYLRKLFIKYPVKYNFRLCSRVKRFKLYSKLQRYCRSFKVRRVFVTKVFFISFKNWIFVTFRFLNSYKEFKYRNFFFRNYSIFWKYLILNSFIKNNMIRSKNNFCKFF